MARVGTLGIFPQKVFGRQRVFVCKLARTQDEPENIFTCVKADNWRDLEPAAAAYLLATYGTLDLAGANCPRSIARDARWQGWAALNMQYKGGS